MTKIETSQLIKISGACNKAFSIKISIYLSMMSLGGVLFFQDSYLSYIGILVLGFSFAHGVELQHQVLHGGAFTNAKLNRITGFLLGAPMLVAYSNYQASHLVHHAKVGTEGDTEFFEFNTLDENTTWITKLSCFFLISHYFEFTKRLIKALSGKSISPKFNKLTNNKIRDEYLMMLTLIVVSVSVSIYFDSLSHLLVWLLPLCLIAAPIHTLIEFPEHFGCNNESEDIFENTRSIRASSFMVWYTNGNNYHVEHHMYPLVRPEKLSILHRRINSNIVNINVSYSEFFLESI